MSYSVEIFRTLGQQAASQITWKNPLKRWGEESGYIEILQQRTGGLNTKWFLLIQENQIFQVREFSAFLCMERCKSLGSLKSFLSYAYPLSGTSILFSWRPEASPSPRKRQQKSKMAVWGGLKNSCEKKRSQKAKEKRKDISIWMQSAKE